MNNIVKYGMYFIILTAVGMLYERYNRKFNHFDEVRQYELIKKYLLNDSSLASSKKPIIWIHTTYDVNARNWESFYSRNNEKINQPYLYLTMKSIIDKCGKDFNICLIDDRTFTKLIPGWNVDIYHTADPIRSHLRKQALMKLLYYYGGMLVPNSFLCKQNLLEMYETNTETSPFVCETVDRTSSSFKSVGFANIKFMGCKKQDVVMKELCDYTERLSSTDYTSERDFTGDMNKWCYNKYMQNQLTLVSGRIIGTIDAQNKPVLIDDLLDGQYIHFDRNIHGIYIPADEVLNRRKFGWFARLSPQQILESEFILAKHFVAN